MAAINRRLAEVRRRVNEAAEGAGRSPDSVTLVAVSKTHPAELVVEAFAAGATHFGENRVQEAVAKRPAADQARWHLIGPLQRNKVRPALETFDLIQTVDRMGLVERLERLLEQHWPERRQRILLEINLGAEEQKAGVLPADAGDLLNTAATCGHLQVEGLMAIPPWGLQPEQSRPYFVRLRQLRDRLQQDSGLSLPHLSMGMSQDFEVAVAEGATIVRVGTAIFGARG